LELDESDDPSAETTSRELPWARIAWTIAVAFVAWLLPRVPIPGVAASIGGPVPSLFAVGLNPVVTAALIVELAALCVAAWRPLRFGPQGRRTLLQATLWVALVLASVQAAGVMTYLSHLHTLERRPPQLVVGFSIVAGTVILVALAELFDRRALGGGYSLLLTVPVLLPWTRYLAPTSGGGSGPVVPALLVAGATAAFLSRRPWRPLRLPACGILPLSGAAAVLSSCHTARVLLAPRLLQPSPPVATALELILVAVLGVSFGFLLNRPSKVAALGTATGLPRAVAASTLFVLALAAGDLALQHYLELPAYALVALVTAVALVLDVVAEARALAGAGEWVSV
jgi:hypothetical protein